MARISLQPDPNDVRVARAFCATELARALGRSGVALDAAVQTVVDDAEMITSELVTNAVRANATRIELEVRTDGRTVRVSVTDDAGGEVAMASPRPLETSGRGLRIVEDLAARWGVDRHATGKSVWAALDLVQSEAAGAPPTEPPRVGRTAPQ